MKNHFIMSYAGNKRQEVEKIHDYIKNNMSGIDTIIEPFCGSSALSYYISLQYPKKYKYILNDLDENLIALYNIMKNKEELEKFTQLYNKTIRTITNKETYIRVIKEGTLIAWFVSRKIYQMRSGLCPVKLIDYNTIFYKFDDIGIVKFLQTEDVTISGVDGGDIIKTYQNRQDCFIFIDPPYIMSCNLFYEAQKTNIYEYFNETDIGKMESMVVLVLEDNWIIKLLFKSFIKQSYEKKYSNKGHKKTNHIIISNK